MVRTSAKLVRSAAPERKQCTPARALNNLENLDVRFHSEAPKSSRLNRPPGLPLGKMCSPPASTLRRTKVRAIDRAEAFFCSARSHGRTRGLDELSGREFRSLPAFCRCFERYTSTMASSAWSALIWPILIPQGASGMAGYRRLDRADTSLNNGRFAPPPASFCFHRYLPLPLSPADHGIGAADRGAQNRCASSA